jgi:hypothetical protein
MLPRVSVIRREIGNLGDLARRLLAARTGRKSLTGVLHHWRVQANVRTMLKGCIRIHCLMSSVTSQFLWRAPVPRAERPRTDEEI